VPTHQSGKSSSEIRIGLRKNLKTRRQIIKVDKKILSAGYHYGSTYYQHLSFINAIKKRIKAEVSLQDGLVAVAIGEAAEKSIKEKRLVYMKEIIN